MTTVVDICNAALSHLGDSAIVTSIDPPDGSVQAEHCARFYRMTIESLQEGVPWSFTTKRATMALVDNPSSTWRYAYAPPANILNLISVLAPSAASDYSANGSTVQSTDAYSGPFGSTTTVVGGAYAPQDFVQEMDESGNAIILTNQEDAVLRYTIKVNDATKFTPLFCEAASWLLASKLAGPIIKGSAGIAAAKTCLDQYRYWLQEAADSDASQRQVKQQLTQQVSWLNVR